MKNSRINAFGLALMLLFSLAVSCTDGGPAVEPPPIQGDGPADPNLVVVDPSALELGRIQLETVTEHLLPRTLSVAARVGVNENRTVRVGALLDGRITRILASVGDRVEDSQVLAELASHEVDDTRAEYAKAVAERDRAEADVRFLEQLRDRAARLLEIKAGSLDQLQRAEAELNRARTQVKIAQAEVGRLEEHLEHIGLSIEGALEEYGHSEEKSEEGYEHLETVRVTAPQKGTVLERLITPGSVVSPADDLFILTDLSLLWVHAEVPEEYLPFLQRGQIVHIRVDAYPDQVFEAKVDHVGDVLNPATRTVQVRCVCGNLKGLLRAEMYATAEFELGQGTPSLAVSLGAIQTVDDSEVVFVQTGATQFEMRRITSGDSAQGLVAVSEGLGLGDIVAVEGSFLLKSEALKSRIAEE